MTWSAALPVAASVTEVLGGLALFLFGLSRLSKGLESMAGESLRNGLQRATRHATGGYALGTSLGFLLHSSGATVMLVGFLNAGLVGLHHAIPVMLGANVGTTLNMQMVSLQIEAFSYPMIALGFALGYHKRSTVRSAGTALFGFGLLFLGMEIMSGGVEPYKADLAPLLQGLDGTHGSGMLAGIGLSLLLTSILQSSGATIGMTFALVHAGIYTQLAQVMPIVLGAHIGTCVTALLASVGSRPPAWRIACSHLLFNVFNVTLAVIFRIPILLAVESLGGDLARQTANLHTGVMLAASLLALPFAIPFASLLRHLIPSPAGKETEQSFLTPETMASPVTALPAIRQELVRLSTLGLRSLELTGHLLLRPSRQEHREVKNIETIFDAIKTTMLRELRSLSRHPDLKRKDLLLIDHWMHSAIQMERIGDHLDTLRKISEERRNEPGHVLFGRELNHRLERLFDQTRTGLLALADWLRSGSLRPSGTISGLHDAFLQETSQARHSFTAKMTQARLQPRALYYYSSYLEVFERLFRHIQLLASPGTVTILDQEDQKHEVESREHGPPEV